MSCWYLQPPACLWQSAMNCVTAQPSIKFARETHRHPLLHLNPPAAQLWKTRPLRLSQP